MKPDLFSTRDEPALTGSSFKADPSEARAAPTGVPAQEIDRVLESVENEPDRAGDAPGPFATWLDARRAACTREGNLAVTAVAALVGGPFAVLGAFLAGRPGLTSAMYIILFGPVTEELLKQSGMIYLLERKPYRIYSAWQFVCAAAVSAMVFAAVENLMYIFVYEAGMPTEDRAAFAAFRWSVCTALHVSCSVIAALGLVRVWQHQLATGKRADLGKAFPLFVVAIAIHCLYNLAAVLLSENLYPIRSGTG